MDIEIADKRFTAGILQVGLPAKRKPGANIASARGGARHGFPDCIARGIGGGVGLAGGFLDGLREALCAHPEVMMPELALAKLGADAGVVGAADIAASTP